MKKILLSVVLLSLMPMLAFAQDNNKAIQMTNVNSFTRTAQRISVSESVLGLNRDYSDWGVIDFSFTMGMWANVSSYSDYFGGAVILGHQPETHINYNGSFSWHVIRMANWCLTARRNPETITQTSM